ncbi:MAG: carbohydrate-binding protein [Aeromicrobium sp.]
MSTVDGRRLSWIRLSLLLGAVIALVFVAMSGWRVFQDTQAAARGGQAFVGYVDATVTPLEEFEEPVSDAAGHVALSFVVASPDDVCQPAWGGAYTLDDAARDLDLDRRIARLRQQDGSVMVSFGGAINSELATTCEDPAQLLAAYGDVVDRYDLQAIDLDIEGAALTDVAANARRAVAIQALQESRPEDEPLEVWLTLPVAPTGLTDEGRAAVSSMLDAGVDLAGVNVMTMDFGGARAEGQSMIDATTDALEATHDQLGTLYAGSGIDLGPATVWKRMGATPMIGQNDVAGEVFTLADARALSAFAADKGLARLSLWSLNRDRTCGANYPDVKTVSNACSGVAQGGTSFATILAGGVAGPTGTPTPTPEETASAAPASLADDPATSPYPIWSVDGTYVEGTRIVWHRNAYVAKWWTLGDVPDDPVVDEASSPWRLIGPVLPGETPIVQPTVPTGTYPAWVETTVYHRGERVMLDGLAFTAKWWTQGTSPDALSTPAKPSPWRQLTDPEVRKVLAAEG